MTLDNFRILLDCHSAISLKTRYSTPCIACSINCVDPFNQLLSLKSWPLLTFSLLLKIEVKLAEIVDSKNLYTFLSSRQNSIDRSTRANFHVIQLEYEVGNIDELFWLPGSTNLTDSLTKTDSTPCQALQLLMHTRRISLDVSKHESRRYDRSFG